MSCARIWNVLTNNLNLDIHCDELLRKWVDPDKAWVDCADESSKLGDQADIALVDRLVWVRAADAARNRTQTTNDRPETLDHRSIPAVRRGICAVRLDDLSVRWLKIFSTWRLHRDQTSVITIDGGFAVDFGAVTRW